MSTLDEITKEKQRVGEVLVRVDAQREQLVSQLRELEATERVLARYTKGAQARKTSSAKMPTKVTAPAAPARLRGRRRTTTAIPAGGGRGSSKIPLYGLSLGMSVGAIGMLVGARSLLTVFLSIHVGVLMDRFGTRRVTLFFVWTALAEARCYYGAARSAAWIRQMRRRATP